MEPELCTIPDFTPDFSGICVTGSLVWCVCFAYRCLSFCPFSFGHCVVCPSSIYGFWLPLWHLQTLFSAAPVYGAYISLLIPYSRDCACCQGIRDKRLLLTMKLQNQGLLVVQLTYLHIPPYLAHLFQMVRCAIVTTWPMGTKLDINVH